MTALDFPAHGVSTGRFCSLPEFVDTLRAVGRLISPVALIGHSLGAAACALGIESGGPARAAVLIAAPAEPGRYTRCFARYVGLGAPAVTRMERSLETRYGPLADLSLTRRAPSVPVLLVHDRGDTRVPVRDALELAGSWPDSRLLLTRGLGHHRILADGRMIRRAARFIERAVGTMAKSPARSAPRLPLLRHAS